MIAGSLAARLLGTLGRVACRRRVELVKEPVRGSAQLADFVAPQFQAFLSNRG
jgi:hypothetical protein